MGISGTDKALMYAQSGVARAGATRCGYHSPYVFISIGGTHYATGRATDAQRVLADTLTITDIVDEEPTTCAFMTRGFTPTEGQAVIVTMGSKNTLRREFAGRILRPVMGYVGGYASNYFHTCNCIDYTFWLNKRKVWEQYTSSTVGVIAADLISTYASGYTCSVNADISSTAIDEITFTAEDLTNCLTRLCKRAGAHWKCDYNQVVRLAATDISETDPTDLTISHDSLTNLEYTRDVGSIITRMFVEGGGANALADVAVGETILPVETAGWYNAAGGFVVSGPQRIAYTGVNSGGSGALIGPGGGPSSPLSGTAVAGAGLGTGIYQCAFTFVTGAGESLPGPTVNVQTGLGSAGAPTITDPGVPGGGLTQGAIYRWRVTFVSGGGETDGGTASNPYTAPASKTAYLISIPIGPSGTTARKIYRTAANGSAYYLIASTGPANNTTTTWTDGSTDGSLGAAIPSTAKQISLSAIAIGPTGTTQRKVYRTVVGGSQLKLQQTIANNTATVGVQDATADGALGVNAPTTDMSGLGLGSGQVIAGETSLLTSGAGAFGASGGWAIIGNGRQAIRYAGITGNTLTGIPATGAGAIVSAITYGSSITAAPMLTGIPASGTGAILYTIKQGDPVNLLVQVDDVAAQTALAALIGGDGIQEDYLQDNRLSYAEAVARGMAHLNLRKDVELSIRYQSRDRNTKAGRTVTVNLGAPFSLSADFVIQRVTVSRFNNATMPTYDVEASNNRFSLEDLLRMIHQGAA